MKQTAPVHLQQTPTSVLGWIEVFFSWWVENVFWGLIPIISLFIVALLIGQPFALGDDLRVGATVLTLTLCATQLPDNVSIPPDRVISWKWAKNFSHILIWCGGGFSFLNAFYMYESIPLDIDTVTFNSFAVILLALAMIVAFWGFTLKLAINTNFYERIPETTESLVRDSKRIDRDEEVKL